jgi:glycosyltransferase involved in cell wall biosynthesis
MTPIAPAATGNGLAMRAGMWLDALAAVTDVDLVIVAISGADREDGWAAARAHTLTVVDPLTPDAARTHTTLQLADPVLRNRIERTAPLPRRAVLAPPTRADEVRVSLPTRRALPVVLVMRLDLAPLGIQLAHTLGASRVVVDADDDDGALLRSIGHCAEADGYDRLAQAWLPDADAVVCASDIDATTLAGRTGVGPIGTVPNAVAVPTRVERAPGGERLLFVGNLTYEPNRAAARLLATEVLPRVRGVRPGATLDLVGEPDRSLADLGAIAGVRLTGAVPAVEPYYATADVVVAPLRHGSGTRIKVLEAFAHCRPLVATAAAVRGLDVTPGREFARGESADELAHAVDRVLADRAGTAVMVERAAEYVHARHRPDVVAPQARAVVLDEGDA